jgi:3-hydroxy-3-methylglutaryl CoA synthase
MPGISAYGAYLPRGRLSRATIAQALAWVDPELAHAGAGERAVCHWDEDAVTMAVAAARACGSDAIAPSAIYLASTTLPFADRNHAALIASALHLDAAVATLDAGGSQRAGSSLLRLVLEASAANARALVIAADHRLAQPGSAAELRYGDGAAAVLVGGEPLLARLAGAASVQRDLVDHYRAAGASFDYALEQRWIRDEGHLTLLPQAAQAALADARVAARDVDHLVVTAPRSSALRVAQQLGIAPDRLGDDLVDRCGDSGAAHALLLLAQALDRAAPGQRILVLAFGQGADALLFETTEHLSAARRGSVQAALARGVPEPHYTRYLAYNGLLELDWGLRAERDNRTAHTVHHRRRDAIDAFVAGRCARCETVHFPKSIVCVHCGARHAQEDHRLADATGRVKSYTEDWQAHTPGPPLMYGNVEFDGGANVVMEFTDCGPGDVQVGMPVRMVFRVKDYDTRRDFRRYFWKAVPER